MLNLSELLFFSLNEHGISAKSIVRIARMNVMIRYLSHDGHYNLTVKKISESVLPALLWSMLAITIIYIVSFTRRIPYISTRLICYPSFSNSNEGIISISSRDAMFIFE